MGIPIKRYRLKKSHMEKESLEGFVQGSDVVGLHLDEKAEAHKLRLCRLDSMQESCVWGRMVIDATLPENSVCIIRFYASDEDMLLEERASRYVNTGDLLMYEQTGRYLFIWLEILGSGPGEIRQIEVYAPGDNFLSTFPEVYREHGSFFHRYLSIFSSIYMDFQQTIDQTHTLLDVELAPPSILPVLAEWMGIENEGDILEKQVLRRLLREASYLNRFKGTKRAIEKVAALFYSQPVTIMERSALRRSRIAEDNEIYDRLYGSGSYDFTILIRDGYEEEKHSRFLYLMEQFKPARTHANLVYLKNKGILDGYSYLDINASLHRGVKGMLDTRLAMDGSNCMTDSATAIM